MIAEEHAKGKTKLYLCDGHGCTLKYPEDCYKNGGECVHTADPKHSIKKKLGNIFPETVWHSPLNGGLQIEEVNNAQILEYFQGTIPMTPKQVWQCFQLWLPDLAQKATGFMSINRKNTIYIYMNDSEKSNNQNSRSALIFTVSGPNQWSLKTERG